MLIVTTEFPRRVIFPALGQKRTERWRLSAPTKRGVWRRQASAPGYITLAARLVVGRSSIWGFFDIIAWLARVKSSHVEQDPRLHRNPPASPLPPFPQTITAYPKGQTLAGGCSNI